jgi:hypothetical protein
MVWFNPTESMISGAPRALKQPICARRLVDSDPISVGSIKRHPLSESSRIGGNTNQFIWIFSKMFPTSLPRRFIPDACMHGAIPAAQRDIG